MTRKLWFRLATCLLVALCVSLAAEERKEKERDARKKGAATADQAIGGKEKTAEAAEAGERAERPAANPADVDAFRQRKDAPALEIVKLYDEIDKAYVDLKTAMNVAQGDDKEARKAKTEAKTLEAKIKRQSRRLETAVGKFTQPIERDYKAAKRTYDQLQEKARQLEAQKQEKKATAKYQEADRYTGQTEAAKRTLDVVRSFLFFESAEGLDLGKDAKDAKSGKGGLSDKGGNERD